MTQCTRWLWVMVLVLFAACRAESDSTPTCDHGESCVYGNNDVPVCHQPCERDAGTACPSGEVCTGASVCCTDTPADKCRSPQVMVCCPASGC